jgi:tRNA A-37 threonylcarbamoyl transferase component Bud32
MKTSSEKEIFYGFVDRVSQKRILTSRRQKRQGQTVTIFSVGDMKLDKALIDGPNLFLRKACKVIKSEKKIKVGHLPLQIGDRIRNVYIKQHSVLSLGSCLGSLFVSSAAMRSLCGADILLQADYATARPIAAVEYRSWGVLTKSLYLSEEISGAKTVETFWREDLSALRGIEGYRKRRAFLTSLARIFRSLHSKKIYHGDLKASNILVLDRRARIEERFSLIDLAGVRKCFYVSTRRRIKNLAQLNRTLGAFLTKTERLFFLKAYMDFRFSSRTKKREIIDNILAATRRQLEREKRRSSASNASGRDVPTVRWVTDV